MSSLVPGYAPRPLLHPRAAPTSSAPYSVSGRKLQALARLIRRDRREARAVERAVALTASPILRDENP